MSPENTRMVANIRWVIARAGLGLLFSGAVLLSACELGPQYRRPDVPQPAAWQTSASEQGARWPSRDWWHHFGSTELDAFIAQSQHANDDIAAAIARVQEADAQARIAGAPLLPSLQIGFQASQQRAPSSGGGLQTYPQLSPLLSASYALDFWGKNQATLRAAQAVAAASRFDRATIELTVMSSVASTYFLTLELRDRLAIAKRNFSTAQAILKGLQQDQQAGTVTALDVAQQETTAETLNAAIPPLTRQLQQSTDALATLLGEMPENLKITGSTLEGLLGPEVQPGLPSELIARRPDIAEAEAQLVASNANIAAAHAAFFPSITLTANGGYESNALSNLVNPANAIFQIAGSITQPIFEGGALRGQLEYAKARDAEMLADYHKTVIAAFANVEDALIAQQQSDEQAQRQQRATEAARHAFGMAQTQLHAGTINVLTLLGTESAVFTAEDALAQAKYTHFQSLVSLFAALGGGWQQSPDTR
jgi:NodT family efflux transporter outer membrane factor (OMF) lipoprotein